MLFPLLILTVLSSCEVLICLGESSYLGHTHTDDFSPRTGYACEGSTLKIECAPGMLIRILRANYGRFRMEICNDGRQTEGWNLECMSSRSLRIVSDMCDKRSGPCFILATNRNFGDPCNLTPKYLEVQFRCETENPPVPVEHTPGSYPSWSTTSKTFNKTRKLSTIEVSTSAEFLGAVETSSSRFSGSTALPSFSPPPLEIAANDQFCEQISSRSVHWPRSEPGQTVVMECPNNPAERKATWHCGMNPVRWVNWPDLSQCISPQVASIHNLLLESQDHFNPGIIEVIASDMVQMTEPEEDVFGGDLSSVTTAMQKAVDQVDEHVHEITPEIANHLVNKVNQAVLKTSSNLLDKEHFDSWKDLPQAEQAQTATRMISTIENSAFQVARTIQTPTTIVNVTVNIVMEVRVINVNEHVDDLVFPSLSATQFSGSDWTDCDNTITLPGNTIKQLGVDGLAKVIFATYNNLEQWLNSYSYEDYESGDDPHTLPEIKVKHGQSSDDPHTVPEIKVRHGQPVQKGKTEDTHPQRDEGVDYNDVLKPYERGFKDVVNSKIISASINDRKGEHVPLVEPIIYTLEHITEDNIYNPSCSFWDYSEKTMDGNWSTFGCKLLHTNTTHTTCACEHLTNFAVLMSVRDPLANLSYRQKFSLSLLTYFGCILSIVCLIACFITFVCFKNLQCDRNTIHANLAACLCIAEIVFLFGIVQYDKPIFCAVIAGVLHYLFLVTFAWMCLEGIQLYVMLVEVFETERSRVKWYYGAAYGIPAIIVAISAIVYHDGYGSEMHCWLKTDRGFIWAFVGPVCAILLVNFGMLSVAIYVMCRHASSAANNWKMKEKSKFENIRSWVKGALVLVVLLGLTWTFGLFYINEDSVVMAYLFTILNSLQGVFIFIFHCVMNDKVMKEYKRWVRHTTWLPETLRVKFGGARASVSSPVNSTSSGVNKLMNGQKVSLEHLTRLLSGRQRKRSSTTSLPSSSSINNHQSKRGYNRIQRDSSGRESGQLTDSGIACNDDVSHIYSEPTEDPNAYLEPVRIGLDPNEEYYMIGGEMSIIEGSVADTDYLDTYGRQSQPGINIDKYKIMPPLSCYNNRLSTMSEDKPVSESDFSDAEAYTLTPDAKKMPCEYEKEILSMPLTTNANQNHSSDESLIKKKLKALEDDLSDVILFNNLNKATDTICKGDKRIAEPNIETSENISRLSGKSDQSSDQEASLESSSLTTSHQGSTTAL